ncbi:MAG TPA: response regulator [Caulobacteraceae bacterium]|nr:response regulator [Caulobacteraceae bacterium]
MPENPPTVLILVDDDTHVLAAMKFAFEVDGFDVRAYPDAESLLADPPFHTRGCLVLDYQLPGINGLQLLKILRSRGVALPAVLITTPTPDILARAASVGAPVVEKPLVTNALLETVRRLLVSGAPPA